MTTILLAPEDDSEGNTLRLSRSEDAMINVVMPDNTTAAVTIKELLEGFRVIYSGSVYLVVYISRGK